MKKAEEAEVIENLTATELSQELNINPSTLRKYSGMIDERNDGVFFKRDASNARIYDKEAVAMVKRMIEIKKAPNVSLEKAIDMALLEYNQENQATVTGADIAEKAPNNDDIALLHDKIDFIGNQLQKLLEQNEQLIKDNHEMKLALEQPEEEEIIEPEPAIEKQSFFAKIFKKK
ncbi:MerR family transcriptional regulator (plasmid) [Desemzia incerta]|uniref:MerR family transcriptional regulator n=1 Tax=Desemzia incerta TaxID=82801 RepID=UPI0024C38E96|nr:MerR family transcriptional regulator [Desemzia incerta]WHZ33222.1 MerR family transcriptional regulator [Desemzia incerta]